MHPNKGADTHDYTDKGINEYISNVKCISLTEEHITGLEQKRFISKQHIMWYKKSYKKKLKCMKQLISQDMLKKINECSADKSDNMSLTVHLQALFR
jgi:adenine C2-methylase RlmN of 23S rRNA A2503 and tRNA A37